MGPGCESAWIAFDPNNPTQFYGGCYQGYIEVLDAKTKESKDIQAYPSVNLAIEPKKMKYRFNWNAPIVASPHLIHKLHFRFLYRHTLPYNTRNGK